MNYFRVGMSKSVDLQEPVLRSWPRWTGAAQRREQRELDWSRVGVRLRDSALTSETRTQPGCTAAAPPPLKRLQTSETRT